MSDHGQPFRDMADRIERNAAEFAGAFVLVPPVGEPITFALIAPTPDLAAFWSMAKAKVEVATEEFLQNQREGRGGVGNYGRR